MSPAELLNFTFWSAAAAPAAPTAAPVATTPPAIVIADQPQIAVPDGAATADTPAARAAARAVNAAAAIQPPAHIVAVQTTPIVMATAILIWRASRSSSARLSWSSSSSSTLVARAGYWPSRRFSRCSAISMMARALRSLLCSRSAGPPAHASRIASSNDLQSKSGSPLSPFSALIALSELVAKMGAPAASGNVEAQRDSRRSRRIFLIFCSCSGSPWSQHESSESSSNPVTTPSHCDITRSSFGHASKARMCGAASSSAWSVRSVASEPTASYFTTTTITSHWRSATCKQALTDGLRASLCPGTSINLASPSLRRASDPRGAHRRATSVTTSGSPAERTLSFRRLISFLAAFAPVNLPPSVCREGSVTSSRVTCVRMEVQLLAAEGKTLSFSIAFWRVDLPLFESPITPIATIVGAKMPLESTPPCAPTSRSLEPK
mmetsp:Transcript_119923/g.339947  ORF Transcript_119923/g.339947 Transcript_119923/m.339947 type:complete len:437 (+) Transcript_119923:560-1870(+)